MKRISPRTRAQLAELAAFLYSPGTAATKAEADRLAREHCAHVRLGVGASEPEADLFSSNRTSGRCPVRETTPAAEAVCASSTGATGRGGHPHGDSATSFSEAA